MFNFTPLLGAQGDSTASQSLLELDGGIKILIDVGWDSQFSAESLRALEEHVSTLSLILLTHPTLEHLGAYAYCCKHLPLFNKIPVYATTPVVTLGRALLIELYDTTPYAASCIRNVQGLAESSTDFLQAAPSSDEIFDYFKTINHLKYSQPHQPIPSPFSPPLGGLTITAYGAGHTLGGTMWHIQKGMESIVYASDWNQTRENLITGASWLSSAGEGTEVIEPLQRPTALVCSCKGVQKQDSLPRRKRDETLVGLVHDTISGGGKVLLPTDTSGRMLELAYLLNKTWRQSAEGPNAELYRKTRIYVAGKSGPSVTQSVLNMLEWLDEGVRAETEATDTVNPHASSNSVNALDWRHLKYLTQPHQITRVLNKSEPCVILASDTSLAWGYGKTIFRAISTDLLNLTIITEQNNVMAASSTSLGNQLWDLWKGGKEHGSTQANGATVDLEVVQLDVESKNVASLSPEETGIYEQYTARQRQLQDAIVSGSQVADASMLGEMADEQSSDSSDSEEEDEDTEHQGRTLNLSAQMTQSSRKRIGLSDAELGINVLLRSKHVHDYDVREKKGREKVFPFVPQRNRQDEFGDLIKAEDYLRAEERDDIDGVDLRGNATIGSNQGSTRRWQNPTSNGQSHDSLHTTSKMQGLDGQGALGGGNAAGAHAPNDTENALAGRTGDGNESASDESDYEPLDDHVESGPRKLVAVNEQLTLTTRLAFVDFEGLHEKRDLQMLIPLIQPRKLILIAGQAEETISFAEECRVLLASRGGASPEIFVPTAGQTIDASVDTNAWTLKLSHAMARRLVWQQVKGLGIVALTGRLTVEPTTEGQPEQEVEDKPHKKPRLDQDESANAQRDAKDLPILDLTNVQVSEQRITQPVHVGDLRLASLRQLVVSSGHTAEFRGEGTLLIDGSVIVRKLTSGRIEVEAAAGGLSVPLQRTKEAEGSFYAVRKLIYEGLALVAGI